MTDHPSPRPPPQRIFRLPSLSYLKGEGVPVHEQRTFEDDFSDEDEDGFSSSPSLKVIEDNIQKDHETLYWNLNVLSEATLGESMWIEQNPCFMGRCSLFCFIYCLKGLKEKGKEPPLNSILT